jgi:predicted transposase YdaD
MNVEIEEEMSRMCNLSEGVLERGRIEGRTEGREIANVESLKNIMEGFSVTFEKAAETLKIPVNEWEKYRNKL